jgi:SAM-dependent methyltransferase
VHDFPLPISPSHKHSWRDLLNSKIKKEDRILVVGCGNSKLSEQLFEDGFKHVVSVDYSSAAIAIMQRRAQENKLPLEYLTMDVRKMSFAPSTFDVVIDKGCSDSLLCSTEQNALESLERMFSEINRVLKHKGLYIVMSYGQVQNRIPLFDQWDYGWSVEHRALHEPSSNGKLIVSSQVYLMVKERESENTTPVTPPPLPPPSQTLPLETPSISVERQATTTTTNTTSTSTPISN